MTYPRYLYDNEQETHRSEQTNPNNVLANLNLKDPNNKLEPPKSYKEKP